MWVEAFHPEATTVAIGEDASHGIIHQVLQGRETKSGIDDICGCNSVVECDLPKVEAVGSNPITRLGGGQVYGREDQGSRHKL